MRSNRSGGFWHIAVARIQQAVGIRAVKPGGRERSVFDDHEAESVLDVRLLGLSVDADIRINQHVSHCELTNIPFIKLRCSLGQDALAHVGQGFEIPEPSEQVLAGSRTIVEVPVGQWSFTRRVDVLGRHGIEQRAVLVTRQVGVDAERYQTTQVRLIQYRQTATGVACQLVRIIGSFAVAFDVQETVGLVRVAVEVHDVGKVYLVNVLVR